MLESSDVNHVAKFLAYYMRADRRNSQGDCAEPNGENEPDHAMGSTFSP